MALIRRKMITKIKPSGKIYDRNNERNNERNINRKGDHF